MVAVADNTVAWVAPKNTLLFAIEVLKFAPVITTVVPTAPVVGVKEVIVSGGGGLFRNTETVLLFLFTIAKSGFPSPSISPMANDSGAELVLKSTFVAKLIVSMMLVFLNIETELLIVPLFTTTKSGLPSPSISPIAIC